MVSDFGDESCDEIDPLVQVESPVKIIKVYTPDSKGLKKLQLQSSPQTSKQPSQQAPEQSSQQTSKQSHEFTPPRQQPLKPGIDARSLNCLEPGMMLNDTIVEFYMAHVLEKVSPVIREKTHVFSTFFYSKIKKTLRLEEKNFNQVVKRWDKRVKLFDKDYLIIPICDAAHWVLVIVCFLNRIPAHDDPIVINQKSRPKGCLIVFDSMGYRYLSRMTDPIRSFIQSRWTIEKPKEEMRNFKDRTVFPDKFPKVPRQRNSYDCGIYLLNSFEKFLNDPLRNYIKIRESQDFSSEWTIDPKQQRQKIKSLLYDNKKDQT